MFVRKSKHNCIQDALWQCRVASGRSCERWQRRVVVVVRARRHGAMSAGGGGREFTGYYARFDLDPVRCIKQLGDIAEYVSSKLGDDVELVLEVRASSGEGFDDSTRRTVAENARSLATESSEFE